MSEVPDEGEWFEFASRVYDLVVAFHWQAGPSFDGSIFGVGL